MEKDHSEKKELSKDTIVKYKPKKGTSERDNSEKNNCENAQSVKGQFWTGTILKRAILEMNNSEKEQF